MDLSIVVPVFNEESSVESFIDQTVPYCEKISIDYEIIFVDDGSNDKTLDKLVKFRETIPKIKIVVLSRNFGKEVALTAGLDQALGSAIIPMDADLQDPPDLIPSLYSEYQKGYDTVVAVRKDRFEDKASKRFFAVLFYKLFHCCPVNLSQ